ncbi:MAG: sel1 repeat family protein [Nitrospira sp. CR1.3]|nr:sel1 repeat family protein [Nitrospira sp. CR1.3]
MNVPRSGLILILSLTIGLVAACQDRRADKAYLKSDYEKSAKELEPLANMGEPRAQYNLALLYDQGLGVPQSDALALRWYSRAAEQGEQRAQYNLGLMYMNGQGTAPDLVLAYYWISLSLAQGNQRAPEAREYLAEKMTQEQIAQAQGLVNRRLSEGQQSQPRVHHAAP